MIFSDLMLDPIDLTRITAVLDWEMVTVGDPLRSWSHAGILDVTGRE